GLQSAHAFRPKPAGEGEARRLVSAAVWAADRVLVRARIVGPASEGDARPRSLRQAVGEARREGFHRSLDRCVLIEVTTEVDRAVPVTVRWPAPVQDHDPTLRGPTRAAALPPNPTRGCGILVPSPP